MKPTQTLRNPAATILVVDDKEVVRRSFQRVLANDHCRVEVAQTNRLTGGAIRPLETQVENAEMS